jgi:hypothetical protein
MVSKKALVAMAVWMIFSVKCLAVECAAVNLSNQKK